MYKVTFSTTYTDSFYAAELNDCFTILDSLKSPKIIEIGYVYKYLGRYWTYDKCWNGSWGSYQTLKQMSNEWFKIAGGPRMKMDELKNNFNEAVSKAKDLLDK